ncbi:hypothetical protein [Schauerella aestuarii]|uniref:hypothetical protein n=1 Tax=Schauerella aestuarii TaxID=2511204 RepID=UPI00137032A7|nr:hypothetical protein [Achromobacter aestuarii]MYZ45957.1 hypothetical protein [Achromobacter aestuarii]
MTRARKMWGLALVVAALVYAFLNLRGLPYEGRHYSPNHHYYYQLSRTYGFSDLVPRMSMPGGGSDWMYYLDGYVRVYRVQDDQLVAKKFVEGMPNAQFRWFETHLLFFGAEGADMVLLPSAAE